MLRGELGAEARRRGWFDESRAPLSHVLMTGGRMYVPDEQYRDHFIPAYARDVAHGVRHHIIERATDESRWYADIDCPATVAFAETEWIALAQAAQAQVARLSGVRTTMLVLRAAREEGGKTGIHLVAPEVTTTAQHMIEWLEPVRREFERLRPDVDWRDVLDVSVYKGGSLRMPLSRKMVPCPQKEEHTSACCGGTLRVDAGRAYELHCFLARDGERDEGVERSLRANAALLVSRASIRRRQSATAATRRRRPPVAPPAKRRHASRPGGARLGDRIGELPVQHRELSVVDEVGDRLRVAGEGSRYCAIAGREHRSSTVFYVIDELRERAYQRCWCQKGECAGGTAGPYPLERQGALPPMFCWGDLSH